MRRIVFGIITLMMLGPPLCADDPAKDKPKDEKKAATPAEQYKAIQTEITQARMEFNKAYQAAKTQEERNKIIAEKYPNPTKYAPRMMELAEKNPKDPVAVDALVWLATNTGGAEAKNAIQLLVKEHIDNPKLAPVATALVYSGSNEAENLLRALMVKNPSKEVKGTAAFSLAQFLKNKLERPGGMSKDDREKLSKETEALFEQVTKDYSAVKLYNRELGGLAKGELFEMRNLLVGKKAPEIAGDDIDGKPFKLSDYQGKVVVLDFWGHW